MLSTEERSVAMWWEHCVHTGTQIAEVEWTRGMTYEGKDPWKRWVACYALWVEYRLWSHEEIPYATFLRAFETISIDPVNKVNKTVRITGKQGQPKSMTLPVLRFGVKPPALMLL